MAFDRARLGEARLPLEQIERGIGGGACEWVGHERRPVHERGVGIVRKEGLEHPIARDRGGERHGAAGERLGKRNDVRHHLRLFASEERAGAAEPRHDFVGDEQKIVLVAGCA